MECKTCGYPLWNLHARQCPECGTEFKPSDFEFVTNSVRFCCPRCDQSYYGTGEKGHLVPIQFDCVTCGEPVHMDTMILRVAEGVDEQGTRVDDNPWLARDRHGRVRGWLKTIGLALVGPGRLMKATPLDSSSAQAWWFCLLTLLISVLGAAIPALCIIGPLMANMPGGGGNPGAAQLIGFSAGFMAAGMGVWALIMLVGLVFWGLITHGLLLITGQIAGGIGRTYQSLCYASGAFATTAVPCVGQYVGLIWWLVSGVIAVKDAQRVSGARASFAVLLAPVLTIVGTVTMYIVFIVWAVSQAAIPSGQFMMSEASAMYVELQDYAAGTNGVGPEHAVEMVSASGLGVSFFLSTSTMTTEADIPIGSVTLEDLAFLPTNRMQAAIDEAKARLPENVVAHRVGDYVFTYHGINFDDADPRLWMVVLSPDPAINQTGPFSSTVIVTADGNTIVRQGPIASLLAQQNAVRAELGLPPLPDPTTVPQGGGVGE